jgi:hypothetical protein
VRGLILFVLATLVAGMSSAHADDWTATRLRGVVYEHVNGDWERLARGDVVPDSRVIRTGSGRVTLARGEETIELGPNTQIRIFDKGGERPFTTVRQEFGEVAVEAEVKDVQHFAVETPYLVAVVKGTRFTVESEGEVSEVEVRRGIVYVESRDGSHTLIRAGQSARTVGGGRLEVDGRGELPEVVGGLDDPAGDVPEDEGLLGLGLLGGEDGGLVGDTVGFVGDTVGQVGDTVGDTVGQVGNLASGAVGGVGEVVSGVLGGGDDGDGDEGDDGGGGGGGLVGTLLGGLL